MHYVLCHRSRVADRIACRRCWPMMDSPPQRTRVEISMPSSVERAEREARDAVMAMAAHRERMARFQASSSPASSPRKVDPQSLTPKVDRFPTDRTPTDGNRWACCFSACLQTAPQQATPLRNQSYKASDAADLVASQLDRRVQTLSDSVLKNRASVQKAFNEVAAFDAVTGVPPPPYSSPFSGRRSARRV